MNDKFFPAIEFNVKHAPEFFATVVEEMLKAAPAARTPDEYAHEVISSTEARRRFKRGMAARGAADSIRDNGEPQGELTLREWYFYLVD